MGFRPRGVRELGEASEGSWEQPTQLTSPEQSARTLAVENPRGADWHWLAAQLSW